MSLTVDIKQFKTIRVKYLKYVCVEFRKKNPALKDNIFELAKLRTKTKDKNLDYLTTYQHGSLKYSKLVKNAKEYVVFNQRFNWDLGDKPLDPGETVIVHLVEKTRWNHEKVLGAYYLGLQVLVTDNALEIIDALHSDVASESARIFVEMRVYHDPAGVRPGTAERMAGFIKYHIEGHVYEPASSHRPTRYRKTLSVASAIHQIGNSIARRKAFITQRARSLPQTSLPRPGVAVPVPQQPSASEANIAPPPPTTTSPTTEKDSTSEQPITSPKAKQSRASSASENGSASTPLMHLSPKSQHGSTKTTNEPRQDLPSPAKDSTPPPLLTKQSLNSRQELAPPTPGTSSTPRKSLKSDLSLLHTPPLSRQVVTSPSPRHTIKSPASRQPITPPQALKDERSSSLLPNSTFHQALMARYAKDDQTFDVHNLTSAQSSLQGSHQSSPWCSPPSSAAHTDNDDTDPLVHVEQNIATLERRLFNKEVCISVDSDDDNTVSRGSKLKLLAGKRFFGRNWSFGGTSEERNNAPPFELEPKHKSKKLSALRSVKNLMRMGRSKVRNSCVEEEMGLLDLAAGGSVPDITASHTSVPSEEGLVDLGSLPDTPKIRKMRSMVEASGPVALKAAYFQVCITIIEARQLTGLNMDPIVVIQVGDDKKFTSVQESTNCPYYNEYFVFDFHVPLVVLLDKIITLSVCQSRNVFRSNKLLGSFKLDVATLWKQPDRQFYHKWALLSDPDDITAGPKGFLKCDISVIGKGDQIKVPPRSEKDDDDIEGNLLLPEGVPLERQRARIIVRIHKAEGLPKMTYSLMANVKKAFTGESQDLVDPYVQVSFAGMTGQTSFRKNTYCPEWNEQIIFTEMFPPLCQRIKIQLKDHNAINHQNSNVIGTHFIDLGKISNDGDRGFLPTFGPAYVYLYGSTRDYSIIDQHSSLNNGMDEGVSYRGRILISICTEIMEAQECPQTTEVEVESLPPITETTLGKNEDFFLFCSIFEANMIDKRLADKNLTFELSIGLSGNNLDGYMESMKLPKDYYDENIDDLKVDTGFWHSVTSPCEPSSYDKQYYYLPFLDQKPCQQIRSIWPDHRRRMYNSNLIANIIEKLEEGLADTEITLNNENLEAGILLLKSTLEVTSNACISYVHHMTNAPPFGNTKLDRERQRLCFHELETLSKSTKNLKALVTKSSIKERLRTAHTYLNRLRYLCEDAQHSMPDVFIWLIGNDKRLAYHRIPAREIIFSEVPGECGKYCAKMQTLFFKWPGKKSTSPSGWAIPAKVNLYLWLGAIHDKAHYVDGLPPGYLMIRTSNAPISILYTERHKFQMRAYIYQGRSLIGSDASGLSDPFARIIIGNVTQTTQVIDQTLSPTWDETLVFEDITLYSTIENIKEDPPTVVVEIFDQDRFGKSEFIGRTLVKPFIKSLEDIRDRPPCPPALEWHNIRRGDDMAGELLATFELLASVDGEESTKLPSLPSPRSSTGKPPIDSLNKGPIMPVPGGIRPTLSKYRIEVLFWGLRDLKRVHFLTVDKPRVDIECSGHTLTSTVIQNANRNPNFHNPTKFIELELPDQDVYQPPLTIRVVDCRSFGRNVLVGTHTINSIQKYIFTPMSKRERDMEERKKSLIQLQNIDLRANCIIQEDVFTIGHERENMPLLPRGAAISYGLTRDKSPRRYQSFDRRTRDSRNRKASADSSLSDDDARSKDWWTKYFASYEVMIEEMKDKTQKGQNNLLQPAHASTSGGVSPRCMRDEPGSPARCNRGCGGARRKIPQPPQGKSQRSTSSSNMPAKKNAIPKSALSKVYPHELEAVPEYEEFKEWLHTFDLYRGKKTGEGSDDESRVVGSFKGAIKVYKWPLPRGIDNSTITGHDPNFGFFQGVPSNEPIRVLVRVYIVKATDLHPMDMNGKADPYIVLNLGDNKTIDKENYVSKQLNPIFGKCYEVEATFPQDSILTIAVYDWDLVTADEMIGETKIDLENRFYSRHRATCGLPKKYEETGYNRWRDSLKPTQILAKLCKDGKIDAPVYEQARVKIGRTVFNMPLDEELFSDPDLQEEQMALVVLHRWEEIPRVGCHLVTEHVETRSLYHPSKPGIEQGRLEMWVDMFPMDMPAPGPQLDISPRKPKAHELRVIIWNTDDVVLEDDAFFTGEKMSDIYVKGWVKGPDDCQSTDIHYRSLTGEGNFNWRFIYPFEYLEAEERIVTSRRESVFSWDETECKIPARLELQVWDADHFTSDDFLGALTLDLNRFPRGAKSAKLCTLGMMSNDEGVPTINIFKQKRVRGWWPFYIKRDTEEMELTGKVEAEIHLLTLEEAERQPAGLGRSEPDAMEKPNRPDSSFMWFLNPLRSMRYIMWHNHKCAIIKYAFITFCIVAVILVLLAFPGYLVKKFLGA